MGKKAVKKKRKKLSMRVGMVIELYGEKDEEKDVKNVDRLLWILNTGPFYDLDDTKYTFKLIKKEPVE